MALKGRGWDGGVEERALSWVRGMGDWVEFTIWAGTGGEFRP